MLSRVSACESSTVVAAADSYLVRLRVPDVAEAADLAQQLERAGATVRRDGAIVSARWPRTHSDDLARWREYTFTELVFFLRAWAGDDPRRQAEVLEERPLVAVP